MKKQFFFATCLIASAIILGISIQKVSTSTTISDNIEAISASEFGDIEWQACYEYDNESAYQDWICLPGENSQTCLTLAARGSGKGRCAEIIIRP